MESKPSTVTQLLTRKEQNTLVNQSDSSTAHSKTTNLGSTVVKGMALLIHGQLQFAEEFGLSNKRVFPQSHHLLDGNSPEKCLKQIFRSGEPGVQQLQELFNDIIDHQLALFSAIDAVATEALISLSPKNVQNENPRRFGSKWGFYKSYHKEFQVNDNFRFNMIVAPGFIRKYSAARENQD